MQRNNRLLYLLAVLKVIIPYLLQNQVYELHRDEFLYLAEGQHPAWGFMEVPPFLSLFAWLTHALGNSMFLIKLWPSLFGAATFIAAGKIVLSLGGRRFALLLLFLPFIFGVYLRIFFLFQPNPPEIFFWTMIAYSFIRYVQTKEIKWLYLYGICTGLGMMSKYSVAFYTASILVALLVTRHRSIFLNRHFWYASLLALLIFLPNLIWQYQASFPVLHHMKELRETQLQYVSPLSFLTDQLLINLPCFFIWLAGLFYVLLSRESTWRFVGLAYLFVIVLLLATHGKNYYSLGAYPPLFAFGAFVLEKYTAVKRKALRYAFIAFPLIIGIAMLPIGLPLLAPEPLAALYTKMNIEKAGLLQWEDHHNHPLPQDFADMLGWEEAARKASAAYRSLSAAEQQQTIVFCDSYGMAGALSYYASRYHLPAVYSDNASFLYWIPANLSVKNLLLVTSDRQELQHGIVKEFQSARLTDSVTSTYARERGCCIYLFKGANENFNRLFRDKLAKDRAEFDY